MKRFIIGLGLLCMTAGALHAQDLDSVQIHGFATQGILFSSQGNFLTSRASSGDPGWTEAVVTISDNPLPKLRVGAQLRYFSLGDFGHEYPTIDWAMGDYKVSDAVGIRVGKIKTPLGLYNESQDIDAVHLWSLLPQSTYAIDDRSLYLSHLGGEVYGSAKLGERGGRLIYRAYGGETVVDNNTGFIKRISFLSGLAFTASPRGPITGVDLRWQTPYKPLMVGASLSHVRIEGSAPTGSIDLKATVPVFFAAFNNRHFSLSGEYRRQPAKNTLVIGPQQIHFAQDDRQWFAAFSTYATAKLQLGTYYSHSIAAGENTMYQDSNSKDFVVSARYDINSNFYAKAENHFLHGTAIGFYPQDNPLGLGPRTDLVIGKLGFYF